MFISLLNELGTKWQKLLVNIGHSLHHGDILNARIQREPEISGRTGLMTSDAWARSRLELHWKRWGAVVVVIVVYSTYTGS